MVLGNDLHDIDGSMTLISWNNGPILKGDAIGTDVSCCCGGGGGCTGLTARCINIYRSAFSNDLVYCDVTPPADVYTVHVHVPECYTFPLTIRITGGVDDDLKVNGTLIEDGDYPREGYECNKAHCVGSKNGYPYGHTTTVSSSPIVLTLVDNFGQKRAMDITVCLDPDGEQGCSECPTTTDEYADETLSWTGSAELDACCVSPDCPSDLCRCVPVCDCGEGTAAVPASVSVSVSVTSVSTVSGSPTCTLADAQAAIDGTYVLTLVEMATYAKYTLTLENGTLINYYWYCTGYPLNNQFELFFCDIAASCFAYISVSNDLPEQVALCSVENGDTTPRQTTGSAYLKQGPMSACNEFVDVLQGVVDIEYTPAW